MSPVKFEIVKKENPDQPRILFKSHLRDLPEALVRALKKMSGSPVSTLEMVTSPKMVLAELKKSEKAFELRKRFGRLAKSLSGHDKISFVSPGKVSVEKLKMALIGLAQGSYQFTEYLTDYSGGTRTSLQSIELEGFKASDKKAIQQAQALSDAIVLCRDLINRPAEDMGPDQFESVAKKVCKESGIKLKVMNEAECKKLKMGSLLAVGRASHRKPRMLVLEWSGGRGKSFSALCGKGVCFDTGGLDIKPAIGMALMRKDMGGAATVLAAMQAIAQLKVKKNIKAYIPLVENAVGPDAFRPGDILTAMDGKTIEIGHTDAEGRLILADAIAYSRSQGADEIITVATLTGAAMVALGRVHIPVMGQKKIVNRFLKAGERTGEKIWELPMDEEHKDMVKGRYADLTNSDGTGEAGCITAGAFLSHFAEDTPFAHCDISPACFKPSGHDLGGAGATGALVTTLVEAMS